LNTVFNSAAKLTIPFVMIVANGFLTSGRHASSTILGGLNTFKGNPFPTLLRSSGKILLPTARRSNPYVASRPGGEEEPSSFRFPPTGENHVIFLPLGKISCDNALKKEKEH